MYKFTSFIIAQTNKPQKSDNIVAVLSVKSAPDYFAKSVPTQYILGEEKIIIDNKEVVFKIKSYYPDAILVQATVEIENIFTDNVLDMKDQIMKAIEGILKKNGGKVEPSEEYTIYQVSGYKGDPDVYLKKYGANIANLLKSERLELDENEVNHTLSSHLKYSKNDLVIVDWDGAFLFDDQGQFEGAIELMQLANYQLLRYRMLDHDLDERLKKISNFVTGKEQKKMIFFKTKELSNAYKEVITVHSQSLSEFGALERDIKLIGDWYSARLYDFVAKKFRINEWRVMAKEKLEALEDVYAIIAENFSISSRQIIDIIETTGWLVLLIGYFVLFYLEFIAVK